LSSTELSLEDSDTCCAFCEDYINPVVNSGGAIKFDYNNPILGRFFYPFLFPTNLRKGDSIRSEDSAQKEKSFERTSSREREQRKSSSEGFSDKEKERSLKTSSSNERDRNRSYEGHSKGKRRNSERETEKKKRKDKKRNSKRENEIPKVEKELPKVEKEKEKSKACGEETSKKEKSKEKIKKKKSAKTEKKGSFVMRKNSTSSDSNTETSEDDADKSKRNNLSGSNTILPNISKRATNTIAAEKLEKFKNLVYEMYLESMPFLDLLHYFFQGFYELKDTESQSKTSSARDFFSPPAKLRRNRSLEQLFKDMKDGCQSKEGNTKTKLEYESGTKSLHTSFELDNTNNPDSSANTIDNQDVSFVQDSDHESVSSTGDKDKLLETESDLSKMPSFIFNEFLNFVKDGTSEGSGWKKKEVGRRSKEETCNPSQLQFFVNADKKTFKTILPLDGNPQKVHELISSCENRSKWEFLCLEASEKRRYNKDTSLLAYYFQPSELGSAVVNKESLMVVASTQTLASSICLWSHVYPESSGINSRITGGMLVTSTPIPNQSIIHFVSKVYSLSGNEAEELNNQYSLSPHNITKFLSDTQKECSRFLKDPKNFPCTLIASTDCNGWKRSPISTVLPYDFLSFSQNDSVFALDPFDCEDSSVFLGYYPKTNQLGLFFIDYFYWDSLPSKSPGGKISNIDTIKVKFVELLTKEDGVIITAIQKVVYDELLNDQSMQAFFEVLKLLPERELPLLQSYIKQQVDNTLQPTQIFRGEDFGSQFLSGFFHHEGKEYLKEVLRPPIKYLEEQLLEKNLNLETQKERLREDERIEDNVQYLRHTCSVFTKSIFSSASKLPRKINFLLKHLDEVITNRFPENRTLPAFFFLRFISPAIVSPVVYGVFQTGGQ